MESIYLDKIINGDIRAFSYFLDKYKDMAYTVAFSIIKNNEDAEEIVQDAFVKAFMGIKKFNRSSKFSTWLYKIVFNEAISKKRRIKDAFYYIENGKSIVEQYDDAVSDDTISNLSGIERKEFVNQVINQLKPNESLLLRLYYLEDLDVNEIKDITSMSTDNIRQVLHRARKNFQLHFEKILQEEFYTVVYEQGKVKYRKSY